VGPPCQTLLPRQSLPLSLVLVTAGVTPPSLTRSGNGSLTPPIKGPSTPPPSPFRSSARDAARPTEFLAGVQRICRRFRTKSAATVSPSPSPHL
jgi:hypothetical protein